MGSLRGWFVLSAVVGLTGVFAGCVSPPPDSPPPADPPKADASEPVEEPDPEDGSPVVTTDLPEFPAPQIVPQIDPVVPPPRVTVPPVTPSRATPPSRVTPPPPLQATPQQLARLRAYYGTRSAESLRIEFTVHPRIDLSTTAVRYAHDGLRAGGLVASATVEHAADGTDSAGAHVAVLEVDISGDLIVPSEHHYGRAMLHLTYRTGPGQRLVADTGIRGPYRLSQVSSTDAVLRSLRAIPDSAYRDVLAFLDEIWIDEVERSGLPYRVEHVPGSEACRVLPIFEIPPRIWYYLARFLPESNCQYTVDPLTGTIRIVYNGDT